MVLYHKEKQQKQQLIVQHQVENHHKQLQMKMPQVLSTLLLFVLIVILTSHVQCQHSDANKGMCFIITFGHFLLPFFTSCATIVTTKLPGRDYNLDNGGGFLAR